MPDRDPKIAPSAVHRPSDSGVDLPAGRDASEITPDDYRVVDMEGNEPPDPVREVGVRIEGEPPGEGGPTEEHLDPLRDARPEATRVDAGAADETARGEPLADAAPGPGSPH